MEGLVKYADLGITDLNPIPHRLMGYGIKGMERVKKYLKFLTWILYSCCYHKDRRYMSEKSNQLEIKGLERNFDIESNWPIGYRLGNVC